MVNIYKNNIRNTCVQKHDKRLLLIHNLLQLTKPVDVIFLTKKDITSLNASSLNHNYATDVITFDYTNEDDMSNHEIYICPAIVNQNARIYKHPLCDELLLVIIHGLLHLAGFNDHTQSEKTEMRKQEKKYLDIIVPRETPI